MNRLAIQVMITVLVGCFTSAAVNTHSKPQDPARTRVVQAQEQKTTDERKKPATKAVRAVKPPKKLTWRDNPNKCNLKTQYIRADNLKCISKPKPLPAQILSRSAVPTGGGNMPCENFRPLLSKYNWDVNTAINVMDVETAGGLNGICNPTASNTTDVHRDINGNVICVGSHGLFQISCHSGVVYDPAQNIAIAYNQKYKSCGCFSNAWVLTSQKLGVR